MEDCGFHCVALPSGGSKAFFGDQSRIGSCCFRPRQELDTRRKMRKWRKAAGGWIFNMFCPFTSGFGWSYLIGAICRNVWHWPLNHLCLLSPSHWNQQVPIGRFNCLLVMLSPIHDILPTSRLRQRWKLSSQKRASAAKTARRGEGVVVKITITFLHHPGWVSRLEIPKYYSSVG